MLRLLIEGKEAEMYKDAPVNLKLRFQDVTEINSALGSFTQRFRLPLTQENRKIFGDIDQVGRRDDTNLSTDRPFINMKQRLSAQLLKGSLVLVEGYLQVKTINYTQIDYAEVEVAFFSGAPDLKSELGGSVLSDLNLNAYNHDLTYANVTSTWSEIGSIYPEIRYGLIDKGANFSFPDAPIGTSDDPLQLSQLTPYIQAKVLFDKIMSTAGFTYESTYLESADFAKVYMPCFNGAQGTTSADADNENLRSTLANGGQATTSSTTRFAFRDNVTNCSDPGSNWNNSTKEYTVPVSGIYDIRFVYSFSNSGLPFSIPVFNVKLGSQTVGPVQVTQQSGYNYALNMNNKVLNAGDKVYVEVVHSGSIATNFLSNGDYVTGESTSLGITLKQRLAGYEIDIAANLPVMKQIDFLTSLQKMFNLVFVPDKSKPKHLHVETYNDYVGSGRLVNWTNKVDYSKDVQVRPTTDLQRLTYEWTYTQGKDFISEEIGRTLDRVYGRMQVVDDENDFARGDSKVQVGFAPYLVSNVPGSTIPIHRSITSDGKGISDPLPMLCYYGGFSARMGTTVIQKENGTNATVTGLGFFSMYDSDDPVLADNDLAFGVEQPLYEINVNPRDTLYIRFWASYVKELYSDDARILRCTLRLNEADLGLLDFNNTIFIDDQRYRLLSLTYDANEPTVSKAELLMNVSTGALCADTPTGYNAGQNAIFFNNSDTVNPDYGSEACCVYYGYNWEINRNTGNRCRPKTGTIES